MIYLLVYSCTLLLLKHTSGSRTLLRASPNWFIAFYLKFQNAF